MKKHALAVCALLVARLAHADGVNLVWSGCTSSPVAYGIEPYSAGPHVLAVTVDNVDGHVTGFDATILVLDRCSSDGDFVPQAWRFDANGCQYGALTVSYPGSYDGCTGLGTTASSELVTTTVYEEYVGRESFLVRHPAMQIRIHQTFPVTVRPPGRYVAALISLDMTNTVAGTDPNGILCGCGSVGREIFVSSATLTGPDGTYEITNSNQTPVFWAEGVGCIIDGPKQPVTQWGADPACMTTSAKARTWGGIKAQYR